MKKEENQFIIVPFSIVGDENLGANEKLLYGLLLSYSKQQGYCFASNAHLAEKVNLGTSTISSLISSLVKKKYLKRKLIYHEGSKEVKQRHLTVEKSGAQVDDIGSELKQKGNHEKASPSHIPVSGTASKVLGTLDRVQGDLQSAKIIDNNNRELELENRNRKEIIETKNTSSNQLNSLVEGNYSDVEIEKYFNNDLFQLYWVNAQKTGHSNGFLKKEELLNVELHERAYHESFKHFDRIKKTVNEKMQNNMS
ncbi:MAG: helix-turn-helix domain-containing protein [Reichenbachiella sp.]|uniref:helix-turn-helix domain-containing protein n=1 Tax=Reichenbachiella sp. TaxID=2184521 RepID=UPI0032643FBE